MPRNYRFMQVSALGLALLALIVGPIVTLAAIKSGDASRERASARVTSLQHQIDDLQVKVAINADENARQGVALAAQNERLMNAGLPVVTVPTTAPRSTPTTSTPTTTTSTTSTTSTTTTRPLVAVCLPPLVRC